jgi:hypothetical protein
MTDETIKAALESRRHDDTCMIRCIGNLREPGQYPCNCARGAALAALKTMRKDGGRLDWLEVNWAKEIEFLKPIPPFDPTVWGIQTKHFQEIVCDSLRKAIDAAREESSDTPVPAEQSSAGASASCDTGTADDEIDPKVVDAIRRTIAGSGLAPQAFAQAINDYVPPKSCECPARRAWEFQQCTCSAWKKIYGETVLCTRCAALSSPCPLEARVAELEAENERLKGQRDIAQEQRRRAYDTADEAIRTRTLAQEASTRDLEALRLEIHERDRCVSALEALTPSLLVNGTAGDFVAQLTRDLEAKRAAEAQVNLLQIIISWQEREAAICPEDFGFEEVISTLRADLDKALEALGVLLGEFRGGYHSGIWVGPITDHAAALLAEHKERKP